MDAIIADAGLGAEIAKAVGKATLGGGLFWLFAWALCRVVRLPAPPRFWLWWLVCAKCVLGFALAFGSVAVTIRAPRHALPPPPPAVALLRSWAIPKRSKTKPVAAPTKAAKDDADAPTTVTRPVLPAPVPVAPVIAPVDVFALAWLCGVVVVVCVQGRAAAKLAGATRNAVPLDLTDTAELTVRFGLRRAPRVLTSPQVTSPLAVGLFRPAVVVPASLLPKLSSAELRLVLAHEMVHVRRGDLWLGLVPLVARTLFFFAPFVWHACREVVQAREEACDARAVTLSNANAAVYGALLVKTAGGQRVPVLGFAAGMAAAHFGPLRRRLMSLGKRATPAQNRAGMAAAGFSLFGLVPWRVASVPAALRPLINPRPAPVALPQYTITDLGTLGGKHSDAFALSEDGAVAGAANVYTDGSRGHAFLWEGSAMHDLAQGSIYRRSAAQSVNAHGQVAAWAYNKRSRPNAFIWDGKRRRYLGGLGEFHYGRALGINNRGQVVGVSQGAWQDGDALPSRPFLWEGGRMRDLGTLGGPYGTAYSINEAGVAVGKADLPRAKGAGTGDTHAVVWTPTGAEDLGTLSGGRNSLAYAVNDKNEVVGFSESETGVRAFYHDGQSLHDLGLTPGSVSTVAYSINNAGQIVGAATFESDADDSARHAVLWLAANRTPRAIDLNDTLPTNSGWVLETARAINARGQIVGAGWHNGKRRAFLLTPEGS